MRDAWSCISHGPRFFTKFITNPINFYTKNKGAWRCALANMIQHALQHPFNLMTTQHGQHGFVGVQAILGLIEDD